MEMFKIIEEFPNYEISENGVIRFVSSKRKKYTVVNKQGYESVQFKKNGHTYCRKVHRLVAHYFLEEPTEELAKEAALVHPFVVCVNHIDGNKTNNHYTNLEWCTMKENARHAQDNNLVPALKGELNGRAELTEDLVHEICKFYEKGFQPKQAIEKFGISRQQATKIRSGHAWKHVWELYDIKVNRRSKK